MLIQVEYEAYHIHTHYSNMFTQPDSTVQIEDYAKVFTERDMHVLAISEHGYRSNVWKQFDVAQASTQAGHPMTALAACETYFVPDRFEKDRSNFHLILVAKNMNGLRQMNRLLSEANISGYYYRARVDFDLLSKLNLNDFLVTSACVGGFVLSDQGERICLQFREMFRENFYLEIQHHPQEIQLRQNEKIKYIYSKHKIPLIYGTDSHYINREDKFLREELLKSANITNGYEDSFDLHLPRAEEAFQMLESQNIFSRAQIEEAFENTLILRTFDGLSFSNEKKIPNSRPSMTQAERNHLYQKEVCNGYIKAEGMPSKEEAKELHDEMDAVVSTNTADYFIAMKDVIDKATENGGQITHTGRGSGVSFATNYALGFTSLNRLKCPIKLYPERFISKDRLASGSLPDLDLNIANLDKFEEAGKQIFGEWGCLPMVAYGKIKTASAFKLLARARELPFDQSNEVSKSIQAWAKANKYAKDDDDEADDIPISDYVPERYLQLVEDSKEYQGICMSIAPHPCAHLLLDKDIREEIGIIRLKSKGSEPLYAACIDGETADKYGYLKADFLRVDVVQILEAAYRKANIPMPTAKELIDLCNRDPEVWRMYAQGYTQGLNQCEREKSTERVMRYKPKNVVELTYFIAGIRPGFKSMLETFISRTRFSYGIPALDKLLQTKEVPDSFLMFDEQILSILQAAKIKASDAYACIKAIKKKKTEQVKAYGEQFKTGFYETLTEAYGLSDEEANEAIARIWTIINDAASYMFCSAHALSMALDSLYAAYLKAHHPYALYQVMLDVYNSKGKFEKVAAIISEMKKAFGISLTLAKFGEDNREWFVDQKNHSISQCLPSIKFISSSDAEELYSLGKRKDELMDFISVLRALQKETTVNARVVDALIRLNYFAEYGNQSYLLDVKKEFDEGKNRITKTLKDKTAETRLAELRNQFQNYRPQERPVESRIRDEFYYSGLGFSRDLSAQANLYFVVSVDDKFGVNIELYSVKNGTRGVMRCKKNDFAREPLKGGEIIAMNSWIARPKSVWKDGERHFMKGVYENWIIRYNIIN